ncbi:cation:proton antiporter [Desulfonatronovibrio hydrogenovorans]|uniref:cation:proton antiporter n=1 Tax=Desulfonatronovibrio hydrogenovorans TaxID=53245 RepID=UPI0005521282|nr:monovalent cation/H(+) antiporter subunit G [Desulfonatronovibrio hydrogenovorans]
MINNILSIAFCLAGGFFFLGGTLGLIRFPDTYSRLHALTKADNLGLGFIVLGLILVAQTIPEMIKLTLIWLLALVGSSSACYFIGNHLFNNSDRPENKA